MTGTLSEIFQRRVIQASMNGQKKAMAPMAIVSTTLSFSDVNFSKRKLK